jgi:hypothetical protein
MTFSRRATEQPSTWSFEAWRRDSCFLFQGDSTVPRLHGDCHCHCYCHPGDQFTEVGTLAGKNKLCSLTDEASFLRMTYHFSPFPSIDICRRFLFPAITTMAILLIDKTNRSSKSRKTLRCQSISAWVCGGERGILGK